MLDDSFEAKPADLTVLDAIARLAETVRLRLAEPQPWLSTLRRLSLARTLQASVQLAGLPVRMAEALDALDQTPAAEPASPAVAALSGCHLAWSYAAEAVRDPSLDLGPQVAKVIQFMMMSAGNRHGAGRYRVTGKRLTRGASDGWPLPAAEHIAPLLHKAFSRAESHPSANVHAADLHVQLALIQPFAAGNARTARLLHALVLARPLAIDPAFLALDAWFATHQAQTSALLAAILSGATPVSAWLPHSLRAQFSALSELTRRMDEFAELFSRLSQVFDQADLPERCRLPALEAALGVRLANARYMALAGVETHTATRDLKLLVETGFIVPEGEKRARHYRASARLAELRRATRRTREIVDPYAALQSSTNVPVTGLSTESAPLAILK